MSETIEIEQDLARRLLVEGATLVLIDVPIGTEFGIDMKSWNTGEKFKGVKMIPPGLHYVYYSLFLMFALEASEEEVSRIRGDLLNLDRYLGPYPFDVWKRWKKLIGKVTELLSEEFKSSDGESPVAKRKRSRPATVEEKEEDLLPQLRPRPGTEVRFTPFPERNFPEGATPAEITQHSLDSSYVLNLMLDKYKNPTDLIGEMQFAFVCFLVGHSLDAFEHWKRLVRLVCSCDDAVSKRREVYDEFITAIEAQVLEIPEDFLVDIVASNNFVYHSLCTLFRNIQTSEVVDDRLKSKAKRFQERLTTKFQWDFSRLEQEDDDDAPVVVDT
ncbi:Protein AAR2 [Blattella germanica]|nr:Protein AAR2 [Blattella germanica]